MTAVRKKGRWIKTIPTQIIGNQHVLDVPIRLGRVNKKTQTENAKSILVIDNRTALQSKVAIYAQADKIISAYCRILKKENIRWPQTNSRACIKGAAIFRKYRCITAVACNSGCLHFACACKDTPALLCRKIMGNRRAADCHLRYIENATAIPSCAITIHQAIVKPDCSCVIDSTRANI